MTYRDHILAFLVSNLLNFETCVARIKKRLSNIITKSFVYNRYGMQSAKEKKKVGYMQFLVYKHSGVT